MSLPAFVSSPHSVGTWLLCLVRDALVAANSAPISHAYVGAGVIAWDDCCGTLVVAPETVYRSESFPTENTTEDFCWGGEIALSLVVLLVRCVPVVDDRGRAPTSAELDDAYKALLVDAATVWDAIVCAELPDEWERASVRQTFVGAEGGCIGVETRLTLGIEQKSWRTQQ